MFLLVLVLPFVFTGCSSNNNTATTQAPPVSSGQEISDIEPTLKQTGFDRLQLTDPILFSYIEAEDKGGGDFLTDNASQAELARVGRQATFAKKIKYNISGIVQILSTTKLAFKSFSYNGSCGIITINPTISTNTKNPFAPIYSIQAPLSASDFEADIPSNLNLLQFDSISIFCSNKPEEPVSTAFF